MKFARIKIVSKNERSDFFGHACLTAPCRQELFFYFIRVFIKRVLFLRSPDNPSGEMRSLPRIKKRQFYSKPTNIQDLYLIADQQKTTLALINTIFFIFYTKITIIPGNGIFYNGEKYNVRILISGNYATIQ